MNSASTTTLGHGSPPGPSTPIRAEVGERIYQVSSRAAIIGGAVVAAFFVATFYEFFRFQVASAAASPSDWGHTLLVPAISGYFVYLSRDKLLAVPFRPSLWGVAVLVLGILIYTACAFGPQAVQHHNLRGVGVGTAMLGVLIALFGTHAMRYLWFPWAYWIVFFQTISERAMSPVTERLQDWSARGAHIMLNLCGVDTDRVGNVLTVHLSDGTTSPLNVAEACSGMRTLVAFMAIGVALAAIGLPRWWQRVLLVAIGIPISIFVNVLRVASLGFLALFDANFTAGEFHSMVGLLWLMPAFLLFLGAMWVIRNLLVDEDAPAAVAAPASANASRKDGPRAV